MSKSIDILYSTPFPSTRTGALFNAINKILVDLPEYEGYEEYCMKIITEH